MKKAHLNDLVFNSMLFFSILTVLQGIDALHNINKAWMIASAGVLIFAIISYRVYTAEAIIYALTLIVYVAAFVFTPDQLEDLNIIFYFPLWVLFYCFAAHHKDQILERFRDNKSWYDIVLAAWTVIVGISLFFSQSHSGGYFVSFAGTSFRLMPSTLIIIALAMYMYIRTKRFAYNFYLLLPLYATFMGNSRTYFGVAIILFVAYVYMTMKKKRNFYFILIPLIILITIIAMAGGFGNKVGSTSYTDQSYFDFWGTVTSGRTVFWEWDLVAFFKLPFWQQFVGNGFNFVYDVNGAQMARIWAHNDIINILMNFGYIGLVVYSWVFVRLVRSFWPRKNKIPALVKILFILAVTLNSMFNMSYTYLCAMISYPLFLMVIDAAHQNRAAEKETVNVQAGNWRQIEG